MARQSNLVNKITYIVLCIAGSLCIFGAIAIVINFVVHGNNSNNRANINTTFIWLAVYAVTFVFRKLFVKVQR